MHAPTFTLALLVFAAVQSRQTADETLTLRDHNFKLSAPVPSGKSTWHVRNEGTEPHQALIVKLPEGVSEYGERLWYTNGSRGPEPGTRVGGVTRLEPQRDEWFTITLEPGQYLLLCSMSEDEGRHFELGISTASRSSDHRVLRTRGPRARSGDMRIPHA